MTFKSQNILLASALVLSGCGVFEAPRTFTDPSYALGKVVPDDLIDDAVDDAIDDAKDGIANEDCKFNSGGIVCTENSPQKSQPTSDKDSETSAAFGPPMGCVMDSNLVTDQTPVEPQQCAANMSNAGAEFEYQLIPSAAGSDAITVTVKIANNKDTLNAMMTACNSCSPTQQSTLDCCTVYCACLMASQ